GIEDFQLVRRVTARVETAQQQTAQQQNAAALLQLGGNVLGEQREGRQREIRLRELLPAHAARRRGGERVVDLGELYAGEPALPTRRSRHLAPLPDAGPADRLDLAHRAPCSPPRRSFSTSSTAEDEQAQPRQQQQHQHHPAERRVVELAEQLQ